MFRNMKTRTKILTLVGVMLLLLILVAFNGFRSSEELQSDLRNIYRNYAAAALVMADADSNARDVRQFITLMMYTDDAAYRRSLAQRLQDSKKKVEAGLAEYEAKNMIDDRRKAFVAELKRTKEGLDSMYGRCVELALADREEEALALFMESNSRTTEDKFFDLLDQEAEHLMMRAGEEQEKAEVDSDQASLVNGILSLVAVVVGAIAGFLIASAITKPLNLLKQSIDVFSKGDLTADISSIGKDEAAEMGRALAAMSESLNRAIGQANEAGRSISEAAHEFSAMAQQTNASVEEFRSNVEEIGSNLDSLASASEEVTASVQEVAAGAQTTAEKGTDIARKVDDAMSAGSKGIQAVQNVVAGIGKVADSSSEATGAIMQLGDRARQIQEFVSQIGGIADQTNLLALNAAIEAARAGEAGRGFAVVAEEVRKLAEDSNVAAKNIADLAGTISSEIESIVAFAQGNASDSNAAKELSTQTQTEIHAMIDYLREIAGATQDLAAVAQEQAASSEEIAEAVQGMSSRINNTAHAGENIRTGISEVAAASERIAMGAENLSSLSGNLQEDLAFFKLDDSPRGRATLSGVDAPRALPRKS